MRDFIFKIIVIGTSDELKTEFLSLISHKTWRIDGVSGHFYATDGVSLDIWFPRENASSKVLATFSFSDVNGAVIVMGRRDKKILARYNKIIHERTGKVPFVGVVLRKNMTEEEKALKSLHAMRFLSEKLKAISNEIPKKEPLEKETIKPKAIAGKPIFKVDEYGFITSDAFNGIPLFVEDLEEKKKIK
ncbi:MAG TPA: hypothetical protein VMV49_02500 [Candidatus Deferrimicrobium sp.]|nr:hypothetical protein [Candidatus Deferrimicrobium sp.]